MFLIKKKKCLKKNENSSGYRQRWEVIQESLLQNFVSSHQLETAILSYNHKYAVRWNFAALHNFFNDVNKYYFVFFFFLLLNK